VIEKSLTIQGPCGEAGSLQFSTWDGKKRFDSISIVTGLQGNEVNGTYVALKLANFISKVEAGKSKGYRLLGKVQIIPVVNFLAFEEGKKSWAFDELDLSFAFPGNSNGEVSEKICQEILKITMDATYGVVLESADSCYLDFPHVNIWNSDRKLKKAANSLQLGAVRICEESPHFQTQLVRFWMDREIQSLSVSCGKLSSLNIPSSKLIVEGLINLMVCLDILELTEEPKEKKKIPFFNPGDQSTILANESGFFVPEVTVGEYVEEEQVLGKVLEVQTGSMLEEVVAPKPGLLLTIRDYPTVYQSEVLAQILTPKQGLSFWPF
jgi:uncharacterized protein